MKLFGNKHGGLEPEHGSYTPDENTREDLPEEEDLYDGGEFEDEYGPEEFDGGDEGYDEESFEGEEEWDPQWDEDGDYDGDDYDDYDGCDEEYDDEETAPADGKRRMSRTKKIIIGIAIGLAVLLGAVALFINYILDLVNYQEANSNYFATVAPEDLLPEETQDNSHLESLQEAEDAESLEATASELEQWDAHLKDITSDGSTYEIPISDDVYNILLIGSDTRVSGEVGRSDAMILVSLNQKTKTIYLTSFLRDCYVSIPGYGNTRLNHAFAYGGPALLEETLASNFKIHIDRYIAVDFFSFMDVVDTLGGIWINVTEEELQVTDDYIWSLNKLLGEEWSTDYIWSPGWQKLNGKQALAYTRNRYDGNDYARTQRQRNVITQIISGAKEASPSTLVSLAQVILPQVTTDMSKSEVLSYAANIGAYLDYELQQQQVPYEGTYSGASISGMSVISLDLDKNIQYLQNTIYAGTEYGE